MTIAPETVAHLDFPTPDVITEAHREIVKLMFAPGKALAIPAEPLEERLIREHLQREELREYQREHARRIREIRDMMVFSSYCSPSRSALRYGVGSSRSDLYLGEPFRAEPKRTSSPRYYGTSPLSEPTPTDCSMLYAALAGVSIAVLILVFVLGIAAAA